MKIHSLKVRGAIGIKKGLGLDEIEVDFTGLSGLIALAGPNGHGKTTLLELLSPYRMFASRDGAMRHHFFLRDSFRDLTFDFGGDIYRALVKIDSNSDRSEGQIWKNGEPQIKDSKVTYYDRYISKLLGSSNLFYNSVFCAQNSDKISDLTTGQLKKLFVEFLRLDRLSGYEAAAKQCVTVLNGTSQQLQRNIDGLQERLDSFSGFDEMLRQTVVTKDAMIDNMAFAFEQIKKQKEEIERLINVQARNSVNIERRDELEKDIQKFRDEMDARYKSDLKEAKQVKKSLSEKQLELHTLQASISTKNQVIQAADEVVTLEEEIAGARKVDDDLGRDLDSKYQEMESIEKEITPIREAIKTLENEWFVSHEALEEKVPAIEDKSRRAVEAIGKLTQERENVQQPTKLARLESDVESCKKSIELLETRGDCPVESPKCRFVVSAISARDNLPGLEKELTDLRSLIKENTESIDFDINTQKQICAEGTAELEKIRTEQKALKSEADQKAANFQIEISELEEKIGTIRESILAVQRIRGEKRKVLEDLVGRLEDKRVLASKLPEIQRAEDQIERLAEGIEALETTIQEKRDQYSRDELQSKEKIRDLEKRLAEVRSKIDEKVAQKILDARAILESRDLEKDNLARKIKAEDENIAVLKQRLEEKAGIEKELARAQDELGRVTVESSQWLYLQNACGKSGLQALEIDGVAPLITGYANDLLTSSFGPNFSVRLITQDPETGKEVLDIVVIRGDGSETSLENLSGGEKVWILKSQRLAMTLVSKEKSGLNFQTILCDEEDGPLDSEKAMSFVGLYKAILEVGGFNDCFFISHNPDVVAMADHWINFSENGILIN
ncbi:AAA family ATPase [Desulfospira joergensenii]|uniref:AAA family ATPase n=1 Tax=Desulfospira joergensenii TaxID=53329 RepID=UPI0003B5CEDA|nr:SMC family ATPase [Desulfospira joergensenii]